ncbi:MAG TPA: dTMP kinase [Gemmatimonadales bacterium]|nr:dTMP kinase [Gemmatimonadales bacterium]
MVDGCFVVVEGPDGAGKSTLVAALTGRMREQGIDHLAVREPGGTPVAEALRAELLSDGRDWQPGAELLYMVTARADLVARVIRPALDAGGVVISDRYDLSTLAYQGAGRGLPAEQVRWVNHAATGGLVPDVTLVLDVDPATGAGRRAAAGKEDRLDREEAGFHQRVTAAYLAAEGPGVHHLNGGASPEAVLEAAWQVLVAARPDRFRPMPGQEYR